MKVIQLKSNGVGRYEDVSPFIVTENKLQLKAVLPPVNGDFYFITEINGATYKRLLPADGEITLDNLTAGELNAAVKHYVKGSLVKTYKIEPLILKEADGNLSAEPELSALDCRICGVESDLREIKSDFAADKLTAENSAGKLEKWLVHTNKNLLALVHFVYMAYNSSPFLNGGTAEKFCEEFGFDLTDEEIKPIKGERKNV